MEVDVGNDNDEGRRMMTGDEMSDGRSVLGESRRGRVVIRHQPSFLSSRASLIGHHSGARC
jgi:hypothetical protein